MDLEVQNKQCPTLWSLESRDVWEDNHLHFYVFIWNGHTHIHTHTERKRQEKYLSSSALLPKCLQCLPAVAAAGSFVWISHVGGRAIPLFEPSAATSQIVYQQEARPRSWVWTWSRHSEGVGAGHPRPHLISCISHQPCKQEGVWSGWESSWRTDVR